MKARYLFTAIGLSIALGAPAVVSAQDTHRTNTKRVVKPVPTEKSKRETVRRSGLPPGFLDQNDLGDNFTASSMRSVTRAGTIDTITGTAGWDTNGQIGTTNQGNLVHGPMVGLLTFHFGSGGTNTPAPPKAHRSPKPKNQGQSNR